MTFQKKILSGIAAIAFAAGTAQAESAPAQAASSPAPATAPQEKLSGDWNIVASPFFPLPAIIGLGGLVLAVGGIGMRRGVGGSVYGTLAGGLATAALLNPSVIFEENKSLPTEVIVVVDRSESQSIRTRTQETNAALEQIRKQFESIGNVNLHVIESKRRDPSGRPDHSNLFATLDEVQGVPLNRRGAVIFLTDGQIRGLQGSPAIIGKNTPLHTLISGKEGEFDLRLVVDQAPRYSPVKSKKTIKFRALHDGESDSGKRPVKVTVSNDGRTIAEKMVTPGEVTEVSIDIPHAGSNIVELRAESLRGELTESNNRIVIPIEGIRERMTVLYISGKPNAGTRMWENMLQANPDTALVQIVTLRPASKVDDIPDAEMALTPLPATEIFQDKIKFFDLIIFDHYEGIATLPPTYFDNIATYVREGGAVLAATGPEFAGPRSLYNSSLGPLLAGKPTGTMIRNPYLPKVSDAGMRHPVTRSLDDGKDITNPAWGRWLTMAEIETPSGHVVMTGDQDKPLLVLERKEKGRVATLLSDNAYLWERNFDGGGPYGPLLQKAVDWLLQDPDLEEEALRLSARDGELIIHQQSMSDKNEPVKITTPEGKTITVTPKPAGPGQWRASIKATGEGRYSAEQGGKHPLTAHFNFGSTNTEEYAGIVSTPDLLRPLVSATGGFFGRMQKSDGTQNLPRFVPITAEDAKNGLSGPDWMGIRMTQEKIRINEEKTSLLSGLPGAGVMLAFALLAGLAFQREGGKGNRPGLRDILPFGRKEGGGNDPSP